MRRLLALALLCGCGGNNATLPPTIPQGHPPPKMAPPHTFGGFSADLPPMMMAPGQESQPCYIIPLTLQGPSHLVGGARIVPQPGLHHGNLIGRAATGTGVRPCTDADNAGGQEAIDVINGGTVLFGSSTQIQGEEWWSFPAGDAYRIKDNWEIVARMHYLNASGQSVMVAPHYDWYTIDESTLVHEMGPFIWDNQDINIPAGADVTLRANCDFASMMHIVSVLPHMHKLGYAVDAGFYGGPLDGQTFLKSPGYDPQNGVIQNFDPPVDLSTSNGAWFSCSWRNTLNQTVVYGVGNNEMCIVFGYAWPRSESYTGYVRNNFCATLTPGP
jgi:hypothetical protein